MSKAKVLLSFLLISSLLGIYGCGCKAPNPKQYSLKLEVWGFLDDRDALTPIFETYKKVNPNITNIEYKKISRDTYKKELVDAMASGHGPDIFLLHNTWVSGFSDKIVAAPAAIVSEQKVKTDFVDTVDADFVANGQVLALPLSVDSLGLYYNKDLFNVAGITQPPKTWAEFTDYAQRLTKIDNFGEIRQSGAAFGTAGNINRAQDILSLLMLQSGNEVVDAKLGRVVFDNATMVQGMPQGSPGEAALNFYTQFARTGSSSYTWNPRLHYSVDAFSEGTVGMMFNYSWQIPVIRAKAPKLNFSVAPIPQLPNTRPINYPNYYAYAVALNKIPSVDVANSGGVQVTNEQRVEEAWKFITFLTTRPDVPIEVSSNVAGSMQVTSTNYDPALEYMKNMNVPAARRDIIEMQKKDTDINAFATGNLLAKNFWQKNPEVIDGTFLEIIDSVNKGQITIQEAIKLAATRINQTMVK